MAKDKDQAELKPNIEEMQVNKTFEFVLSDADLARKAKDAAAVREDIKTIESEFDSVKARYKSRLTQATEDLHDILGEITNGKEERTVDATLRRDYDRMMISWHYEGKVLEERAMTPEERQRSFDIIDGGAEAVTRDASNVVELPTADLEAAGDQGEKPRSRAQQLRDAMREEQNIKTKKDIVT
jgi:hypothetical protein